MFKKLEEVEDYSPTVNDSSSTASIAPLPSWAATEDI